MRYLNLPVAKHPLGILRHFVERELLLEVISAGEIAANFVDGDRRKDGAVREIGLHPLEFVL